MKNFLQFIVEGADLLAASDDYVRIQGMAYGGGKMRPKGMPMAVVVELAGISIPAQIPLLANHANDTDSRIGVVSAEVRGTELWIDGRVLSSEPKAENIVAQAKAGGDWQLSIGANPTKYEVVPAGKSRTINGARHDGPFIHVQRSALLEVSVVALGADTSTRMQIAATFDINPKGEPPMKFDAWLKAKNIDAAGLSDDDRAVLNAACEAGEEPPAQFTATNTTVNVQPPPLPAVKAKADDGPAPVPTVDFAAQIRAELTAQMKADRKRIADIQDICGNDYPEILTAATNEDWSVETTAAKVLAKMRASRPSSGSFGIIMAGENDASGAPVMQAALCLAGGLGEIEKHFDERTLDAADKRRTIGIQEVLCRAAQANGWTGDAYTLKGDIRGCLRAAFSTTDIDGILSNVANKFILDGFSHVDTAWEDICTISPARDFKAMTHYRLTGALQYKKLAPSGQIQHGTLGEESFTNQVYTYALGLGIPRTDIINDDLGALTTVQRGLGRGAALSMNDVFWTVFLDNGTIFAAGNNNYASGVGSALSATSLAAAEKLFLEQVDADNKPLGAMPVILLVPPGLNVTARELYVSTNYTGGSSKTPAANVFAGKYRPVTSPYMSNASYTGYSATKWYLLADPRDIAVMEGVFLNGKRTPTVETTDADFDNLGIRFRGYHDFGFAQVDYRGGTASAGV